MIYLGGLGADGGNLSAHLRSRREVETLLGAGGVTGESMSYEESVRVALEERNRSRT